MTRDHTPDEPTPEIIQECKEWLARRKAWVDQKEKQFEAQYGFYPARINRERLEDLEIWKFQIEIHEYELEETIKWMEDQEDPED